MIRRSAPNQLKSLLVRVNGISAQISHRKIYPILNFRKAPLGGALSVLPIYFLNPIAKIKVNKPSSNRLKNYRQKLKM